MNTPHLHNLSCMRFVMFVFLLAIAGWTLMAREAYAARIDLTAEFRPSALNPGARSWLPTTPQSALCAGQLQWYCTSFGGHVATAPITFERNYNMTTSGAAYQRLFFGKPAQRTITIKNSTGFTADITVAVGMVLYRISPLDVYNPANGGIYNTSPCSFSKIVDAASTRFASRFNGEKIAQQCYYTRAGRETDLSRWYTSELAIGFTVSATDPLALESGRYTGSTIYTFSDRGGDFQVGDGGKRDTRFSDTNLEVHFDFNVIHEFKVDRPPGAERVTLNPTSGWADWIQHGVRPRALQAESLLRITSSGPFSMQLACEYEKNGRCALAKDGGDAADRSALDVAVSMPGYHQNGNKQTVDHTALKVGVKTGISSNGYIASQLSRVHFSVNGKELDPLLAAPRSLWRGNVTVVFDSQL